MAAGGAEGEPIEPARPGERERGWRAAYAAVLACHCGTFLAFSAAFPFMALYVQQLGVDSREGAAAWAGAINSASTATVAVMNLIWGSAADRWGAKAGFVRSVGLGALGLTISAVAVSPEQLLFGRIIQSLGGGANAAALIVVGTIVPPSSLGFAMGLLQTGQSLSASLGPAVGGLVGDLFGFRYMFFGSAVLTVLVTLAIIYFVREPPRTAADRPSESFFAGFRYVAGVPVLRGLVAMMFIFHVAYQLVWTFVPLRMQSLGVSAELVGRWSGLALLADALGIALGAAVVGWLSGRVAARTLVTSLCALAAGAAILHSLLVTPEGLVGLRFATGLAYGGAVVLLRAAIGMHSEQRRRGVAFGVAQGAFAAGFSLGALLGSVLVSRLGLDAAFALSAVVFGLAAAWALHTFPRPQQASQTAA